MRNELIYLLFDL